MKPAIALVKVVESTSNGVEVSAISFSSPDGGSVTGLLFDPVTRSSPSSETVVSSHISPVPKT
jgi:hypothetical protein